MIDGADDSIGKQLYRKSLYQSPTTGLYLFSIFPAFHFSTVVHLSIHILFILSIFHSILRAFGRKR